MIQINFKRYFYIILIIFFIILKSVFSSNYVSVLPRDCQIISFEKGNFRNLEIINSKYLLKITTNYGSFYYEIYSLNSLVYIPFSSSLELETIDKLENKTICKNKYENLMFKEYKPNYSKVVAEYRYYKQSKVNNLFLIFFVLFLIFLITFLFYKKTKLKK
ncbi:MAG: hypothetical protein QXR30_02600 [Candidatus Woesearchaeota archaeon]